MWRLVIFVLLILSSAIVVSGQATLTIESCYDLARNNYPAIKQKALIAQSTEFTIANVRTGFLPQLSISAQATYQSDVTQVPVSIPGFSVETLSKDQYKIYGELSQAIYDGGTIKNQKALTETTSKVEDQRIEVELYQIRERVNQLFFGILLLDEQLLQVKLLQKDLQTNISRTEAALRNGVAFKTNLDLLQAEFLKSEQRVIEMNSMRQAYLSMLGSFINQALANNTVLQKPVVLSVEDNPTIARPELTLFNYQNEMLAAQYGLGKTKNMPRVGLFIQAGYGKPALNMLKNEFDTYYLGGVRLNWNLSGFYNSRRDKQMLDINLQKVDAQKETFLFGMNQQTSQQREELVKLQKLIEVDDKIIELRLRIRKTAEVQEENGIITTNDYLRELNAEDQAKQNKALHEIQLLMTAYAYQNTIGN